jgi:peptide/nickel transport system permease protein
MIQEGQQVLASDPWLSLLPGIMITITVISLNVFGDGLRDALDPRAKVKIEH